MGMKLLLPVLWCLGAAPAVAGQDEFLSALHAYHDLKPEMPAKEKLRLADDLLKEWANLDKENQTRWSDKVFVVHFLKAEILASTGEYKEAVKELQAEWKLQGGADGRLEYSTKNPDGFFVRLVELQALLTAKTGADPLAEGVDYVFKKEGDGFMAARIELYEEVNQITVPVAEGEKLAVVHRITKKDDDFEVTSTRCLVVPEGKIRDVLREARREITFTEDGKLVVRELK
jgi:hypothetical protein